MNNILAIVDQGISSLGNFLTVLLLARVLAPADYGIFAILFGIMLVLNSIHAAIVIYPLSLEAAVSGSIRAAECVSGGIVLTLALGTIGLFTLCFTCLRLQRWDLAFITVVALLLWQLQETCRRGIISQFRFKDVLLGDAFSYLGQFFGVLALVQLNRLSLFNIFSIMAATSFVAFIIQAGQTGVALPSPAVVWNALARSVRLGKWAMLSHLSAMATSGPMYIWILGILFGSSAAAAMQALTNILGVTNPIILAMTALVVPATARAAVHGSQSQAWKCTRSYGMSFAVLVIPYYLLLVGVPRLAVSLFYGRGSHYLSWAPVLQCLAVSYGITYLAQLIGCFLRAVERMQVDFIANLVSALAALAVFVIAAKRYDPIVSATLSFVIASTLRTVILWCWTVRIRRTGKAADTQLVAAV
jgi:hypothetical protein